jgi:hypothetical protein
LGLDELELNVAPDQGVAAELVVGHQLSQQLYVKLQQGLGDHNQTNVILEYEFRKWLRLQTNLLQGASAQQQLFQRVHSTGLDLVFSFTFKYYGTVSCSFITGFNLVQATLEARPRHG